MAKTINVPKDFKFQSELDQAAAYASYKYLEKIFKNQESLPVGSYDVSGREVSIRLPTSCVITRDAGADGNGFNTKTATQDLYGYSLWALMAVRLRKFKQWATVKKIIKNSLKTVLKLQADATKEGKTVKEIIQKRFPEVAAELEGLKEDLQLPTRIEWSPQTVDMQKPASLKIG